MPDDKMANQELNSIKSPEAEPMEKSMKLENSVKKDPWERITAPFNRFYDSKPYAEFRQHANSLFSSKIGIIFVGAFIGVVAAILQHEGNPVNMGFCVACFERDIAGALGLHRAGVVQYLRPEILGFVLGSFIAALMFKEFRARTGSAPMIRFILGFFAMIGALVFLGCPWRALIRLGGGDGNAVLGIAGLTAGVFIGTLFIRNGYNLGRSRKAYPAVGLAMPAVVSGLLFFVFYNPNLSSGVVFESTTGPGAKYAPVALSLVIALAVGFMAQRSRFCTVAGIRDTILIRDYHLLLGVIALVGAIFITNLALDQFEPIFHDPDPKFVAHDEGVWNFTGMLLAGLAFVLAGGCPGRQLILAGEGDADASMFVFGMVAGAAFAHNFVTAATPNGISDGTEVAVAIGLIVCILIGLTMRQKM